MNSMVYDILSVYVDLSISQFLESAILFFSSSETFDIIFDLSHIVENVHNKIVHFPIACGVVTAIFEVADIFTKKFKRTILILTGITSISSVLSVISGFSAEKDVIDSISPAFEPILNLHGVLGIVYTVAISSAFILKFIKTMERVSSFIVIVSVFLIAFVGYLGGILAH